MNFKCGGNIFPRASNWPLYFRSQRSKSSRSRDRTTKRNFRIGDPLLLTWWQWLSLWCDYGNVSLQLHSKTYTWVFTARRYTKARSLLSPGVRPSVCLSVCHAGTLYPDGWRYQTSFWAGSPIILVLTPSADTQFQGEPLQQGRKIHVGWENFAIFDWHLLLWNVNRKSSVVDTCRFRWPWVILTWVSKSLYSYKSNISKTLRFRDKVTMGQ